ncbi:hypothetical protein MHYP_G00089740 [Metynnis hypsauchen]
MPPLSSPAGCDGCAQLSLKILELEEIISVLYQIKDDDDLLDSLLATTQRARHSTSQLDTAAQPNRCLPIQAIFTSTLPSSLTAPSQTAGPPIPAPELCRADPSCPDTAG